MSTPAPLASPVGGALEGSRLSEHGVRLAQTVQAGPCIPVGMQLENAEVAQLLGQLGGCLTLVIGSTRAAMNQLNQSRSIYTCITRLHQQTSNFFYLYSHFTYRGLAIFACTVCPSDASTLGC